MNTLTYLFLIALALAYIIQIVLTVRQQRSVDHQRQQTPAPFQQQISLAAHQKAAAYTIEKLKLERINLTTGTLLIIAWTLGGGLDGLNQYWLLLGLSPLNNAVVVILCLMLISHIIDLPFTLWHTFIIEQKFDFNRISKGLFFTDQIREILVTLLLMTPLLYSILWLVYNQDQWWLTVWLVWTGFTLLMLWAYPTFIAPLFNRFTELDDPILKQRIENLLQRTGFSSNGIFIMDGSRRSGHGNAYFTGLGRSKRIVFYDTLLASLSHDEIEAVLAHELGHFHHGHVRKRLISMILMSLGVLILLSWLSGQSWFYHGMGVTLSNPATSPHLALILFMLCTPIFGVFFNPFMMHLSRRHEYQADAFAARNSSAEQLCHALIKMYKDNATTLTPDPWYAAFYDAHPTALARIQTLKKLPDNH